MMLLVSVTLARHTPTVSAPSLGNFPQRGSRNNHDKRLEAGLTHPLLFSQVCKLETHEIIEML